MEDDQSTSDESYEMSEEEVKALQIVRDARSFVSNVDYPKGLRLLFEALQLCPLLQEEIEKDLSLCLQEYGMTLFQGGHIEQVMWLYSKALEFCPDSKLVRHNLGAFCSLAGRQLEALRHFQLVLKMDPCYWPSLEGMENVKSLAVDRWHFRMLNDAQRNHAYNVAISAAVQQQLGTSPAGRQRTVTVLDIGTGTGILALMALRAGATRVIACETNRTLCELALECITKAGFQDRVKIINKSSMDLVVGQDVPCKVDLIVTELVDSGLLGEHIVPTLRHARATLLRPGGQIIPHGAQVSGLLLESVDIRQRGRLLTPAGNGKGSEGGNVLSTLLLPPPCSSAPLPLKIGVDEPYTCENLEHLPHRQLTEAHDFLTLDFLGSSSGAVDVELPVIESGKVDAVAIWFKLFLLPDSSCPVVDTAPGREGCGWDQGIYYMGGPDICQGDTVRLKTSYYTDRFYFSVQTSDAVQDMDDGVTQDGPNDIDVGEMDIAQLNDSSRFQLYHKVISEYVQGGFDNVLDFSTNWSLLGLVSLYSKAKKAVSYTQNSELVQSLTKISERAAIPPNQYEVYNCSVIDGGLQNTKEKFSLLVGDLIEGSGLVRQEVVSELIFARNFLATPNCQVLPAKISVKVQGIESTLLSEQNFVKSENTAEIDISSVNSFSVTRFRELNLKQLDYKALTEVHHALDLDLTSLDVSDSGLLCEKVLSLPIVDEGMLNAVCYWFEIHLSPHKACTIIYTGPSDNDDLDNECEYFYRQAAVLVDTTEVSRNENVVLNLSWTTSHGILVQRTL